MKEASGPTLWGGKTWVVLLKIIRMHATARSGYHGKSSISMEVEMFRVQWICTVV